MSCSLLGTGFGLTGDLAPRLVATGRGMTEDQSLSDQFAIDGERVFWLHGTQVLDQKPSAIGVLTRQRSRWAQGKAQSRREALRTLVSRKGVWSLSRVDRIARLVLPGRIVSAAVLAVIAVTATIWPTVLAFSPLFIFALLAVVLVVSVAALLVEGAGMSRIVKIPLVGLFALLWIPERLARRRDRSWYHTPHKGPDSG